MRWLLLLSLFWGIAHAQPEETVESLAAAGAKAYKAGDYAKAVGLYVRANQLQPNAPLIYNIAIIYERKIKDPELAIQFYRRYIGSVDVDPAKVPKVNERIIKLKAEIKAREAAKAQPPPPTEPTSVKVVKLVETPPPPPPPPPKPEGSVLPWLVMGTGAALGVAGGVFGVMAQGSADDFSESRLIGERLAARDDGEQQALTADILMGASVATLTVGAIMLLMGGDDAPTEPKASLGFAPHEGGGLIQIGGAL